MEDKSVYSNLLVVRNAHFLYQPLLVADGRQGRHEPTVPVIALSHVVRGRAFYEELRLFEYVLLTVSAAYACRLALERLSYLYSLD